MNIPEFVNIPPDGLVTIDAEVTQYYRLIDDASDAMNKGDHVPGGWIVDKAGRPTTDPKDFYDGGALLTIGAHKGSGLSILTDLLAGAVTTGRSSDPDDTILRNNMLSIYVDPSVYDREGVVLAEAHRFVEWVKASPPAKARSWSTRRESRSTGTTVGALRTTPRTHATSTTRRSSRP